VPLIVVATDHRVSRKRQKRIRLGNDGGDHVTSNDRIAEVAAQRGYPADASSSTCRAMSR
jgi:hypothetical protein